SALRSAPAGRWSTWCRNWQLRTGVSTVVGCGASDVLPRRPELPAEAVDARTGLRRWRRSCPNGTLRAMAGQPSGTVTFLFTDLEVSTRLWEDHPEDMKVALLRHDEILRSSIESHRGHVVKARGDGFHGVFHTAHDAVYAALGAQAALSSE